MPVLLLPSGNTAPLEAPSLAALLSCDGSLLGLSRCVWAHPELDVAGLGLEDSFFVASWALRQFCKTDEAAELAFVGQRFGMAPSQYLHVKDRTLAYALDERCHVAASRVEREARDAAAGHTHFNEGGINE